MIEVLKSENFIFSDWAFYGELEEFKDYSPLIKELHNAKEGDTIVLRINSTGGRCDIGRAIIDAMKASQAKVHCYVEAPSYSMAALIALAADEMSMADNSYLMFHCYSGGYYGKGGDTAKQVQYENEWLSKFFEDICTPFLTKKEFDNIMKGEDFYIKNDDPTLQTRIKRHFK